ncbi:hypothetical protein I5E68_09940 [Novosphingobium sp. YJ-S2-02]|uniref:Uncharacterized protein n=1 Tax=Novosphingobium aureum TaxID=2792964 RepID=A0A931HC70_9SPHN|nr:hypothetical protein [Novosphingobium aureum]MBH0113266.1 hypothetical protein [Novosphingobium aureum]
MAAENYTLGRGELHFSPFKTGTYTPEGFRYLGITPSFNLSISTSFLDLYNSDHGVREKVEQVPLETSRTGSLTCIDMDVNNIAAFFFGEANVVTQTSASAVEEVIPAVMQGRSYQIGMSDAMPTGVHSIANVIVEVASVAKTFGVDYLVNEDLGIITVLDGGGIATGDSITVTYDREAKAIEQVTSGTEPIKGALRYIADNPQGQNFDYFMPYVKMSPNGDFALKAEQDWQQLPFTVEILKRTNVEAMYLNGRAYTPA